MADSDALHPCFPTWIGPRVLAVMTAVAVAAVNAGALAQSSSREITSLTVEPAKIELTGANRLQHVLITAKGPSGTWDVTGDCELSIDAPAIAWVRGGIVQGRSDGTSELGVRIGGHRTTVPVRVTGFGQFPPVDFATDVVPILSKLGCNSGGCHGKASGQNGFKLSVFGFDPAADYDAIVKEARGRRVFPASPDRSLILLKPTALAPHGGGKRLEVGTRDYELLDQWLRQGMPFGSDTAPQLVGLEVSPAERVMVFESVQQILATAQYSDGSSRDVTDSASYSTNSEAVAEVNSTGQVRTGKVAGESAITVHYMGQVAAVSIQVPRPHAPERYVEIPVQNRIDELVSAKLAKMGIFPSELTDDATFLRRLYIDSIGTLPRPDEVRAFVTDHSSDKRSRAITAALNRTEYSDYWALHWADLLLVDPKKLGERGAFEFHQWLRAQFAENRPYDKWTRELIVASGNTSKNGPANFYRALRSMEEVTRSVSQVFLGVRLECAQCHHHPFEKWGQADFYGLAGFFNGLERRPVQPDRPNTAIDPGGPELIFHAGLRETRIPYFNRLVPTQPPGGWNPASSSGRTPETQTTPVSLADAPLELSTGDPRGALGTWITRPENPWFARLAANRLWKHFLGRGLVEPEDDLRSTNPPTNGPLLDYMAEYLVSSGYDLKALMRLILNSSAYQLSSTPNETNRDDTQNFSHYTVKRLSAEVLLDAICEATLVPEQFVGRPPGTRAIAQWDNRLPSYFLEIFGRSERNSPCECG